MTNPRPMHRFARLGTRALALVAAVYAVPAEAQAPTGFPARCAPGEVQVMLLGTYHFGGSDTDAVSTPTDDILGPARQAQLEELSLRLASWAPEQIAIEWPADFADSTTARFRRYAADGVGRSNGEVEQVAFRLARRLGHPTVHPIDQQVRLGNDSIGALLERRPDLRRRQDSLLSVLRTRADSTGAWQRRTTIIEHLRRANGEEGLHGGNSMAMFGSFLAAGEGGNVGGPQLLARWYERNILMAHNLTRVLRPGTRRVLVLVGSGHVPALRNILDESPDFCPVSPLPLLN